MYLHITQFPLRRQTHVAIMAIIRKINYMRHVNVNTFRIILNIFLSAQIDQLYYCMCIIV